MQKDCSAARAGDQCYQVKKCLQVILVLVQAQSLSLGSICFIFLLRGCGMFCFNTCIMYNVHCTLGLIEICPQTIKIKIYPTLVYFNGKFNSKAGLFSSTFLFEHSFGCHLSLLVFRPYSSKNSSKTSLKTRFSKIGLKPTQKC